MDIDTNHEKNEKTPELLKEVNVVNIGLEQFFISLEDQEANVTHVSWSPPAGGDQELAAILDKLL